jgi:dTDP-4-dehydrorhamnose reductase
MKVLITGAAGQVGRALLSAKPPDVEVRAYTRDELDICNKSAVQEAVSEFSPQVLINAAAYTAVDWAETDPMGAMAANSMGPDLLAEAVSQIPGARLIHISTDYVFDGSGSEPHRPEDPTGPLSVYGRTKLAGEQMVLAALGKRAVVLRTAWVYAPQGRNFLLTMLRLMKENGRVDVVADQRGSPTTAASVARAVWRIVERPQVHGILHWTDGGTTSWYDFARAIAEEGAEFGLLHNGVVVKPIETSQFPTAAQRPANSVLDLTTSIVKLDLEPTPWRENLRSTLLRMASH